MAGKEIAVKKYVVKLSAEERAQLEALIHAGKSRAQLLTRARILLSSDGVGDEHQQYRSALATTGRGERLEATLGPAKNII